MGALVDATHIESGRPYRSSRVREDSGGGACEIMRVQQAARVVLPGEL